MQAIERRGTSISYGQLMYSMSEALEQLSAQQGKLPPKLPAQVGGLFGGLVSKLVSLFRFQPSPFIDMDSRVHSSYLWLALWPVTGWLLFTFVSHLHPSIGGMGSVQGLCSWPAPRPVTPSCREVLLEAQATVWSPVLVTCMHSISRMLLSISLMPVVYVCRWMELWTWPD